jgi:hypothetical protein
MRNNPLSESSSRPALGGGGNLDTQAGSLGDKLNASPNVIDFLPRARSWRTSAPSNSRASSHELLIRERDGAALWALGVLFGFTLLAIGLLTFAGCLLFGCFDFT